MVKSIIIASLMASAAAFAPASLSVRSSTKLAAKDYVASESLPFLEYPPNLKGYAGDAGFDPFRFSDFVPMDFMREAELKHCRICMLAVVGFVAVDLGLRIYPLPEAYDGLTVLTAHDALVKYGAMGQLFMWISLAEIFSSVAVIQMLEGSGRKPGDFGFDPLGFMKNKSEAEQETMATKELTNGRLAMLAISGMITQAVLYDSSFPFL